MSTFNFRLSLPASVTPLPSREVKVLLPEGQKDFGTMISIDHNPVAPGGTTTYEWKETEIRYRVDGPQSLYIALAPFDDDDTGSPRFYIYNIKIDGPSTSVHYIDGTVWKPFKGGFFPPGTYMIKIKFNMPRNGNDDKVIVYVYDTVAKEPINCDPLVGNDPP